jgi:hypothetical protein
MCTLVAVKRRHLYGILDLKEVNTKPLQITLNFSTKEYCSIAEGGGSNHPWTVLSYLSQLSLKRAEGCGTWHPKQFSCQYILPSAKEM